MAVVSTVPGRFRRGQSAKTVATAAGALVLHRDDVASTVDVTQIEGRREGFGQSDRRAYQENQEG